MEHSKQFGLFSLNIVPIYGFVLQRKFEHQGEFAFDYSNGQLGLRLIDDHYGQSILLMSADDMDDTETRYDLGLVLSYLTDQDVSAKSLDALAAIFQRNYANVVKLFSRQPANEWHNFNSFLDQLNAERFQQ